MHRAVALMRGIEIVPKPGTTFLLSEEAVIIEFQEDPFIPIDSNNYATLAPDEDGSEAEKLF